MPLLRTRQAARRAQTRAALALYSVSAVLVLVFLVIGGRRWLCGL